MNLNAVPVLAEPPKKPEDQSTGLVHVAIESALSSGEARESIVITDIARATDSRGGVQPISPRLAQDVSCEGQSRERTTVPSPVVARGAGERSRSLLSHYDRTRP